MSKALAKAQRVVVQVNEATVRSLNIAHWSKVIGDSISYLCCALIHARRIVGGIQTETDFSSYTGFVEYSKDQHRELRRRVNVYIDE